MTLKKSIAVLEGDGIGPEIMTETIKVLNAISEKKNIKFELIKADFGASSYFKNGHPFPDATKEICDNANAIMKGPIGLPVSEMKKIPSELSPERAGLLALRKRYDTFANYRPVILPLSCADFSPLKKERLGCGLNILMMRELVGGIYFGEKVEGKDTEMKFARDDCYYSREQISRFALVCFKEAEKRNCILTNVHKSNVLATSRFWNSVFEETAKQFPNIKMNSVLVDNVAYQLVINPSQFNGVMALENMQGDILTDQAGGLLGSLGLMPSACLNPLTGKGYYEPAHGSAPDIAGKGIANPYSMIGSLAFMLEKSFDLKEESNEIWSALTNVFAQGYRTKELAGKEILSEKILSTKEFGDKVVELIKE